MLLPFRRSVVCSWGKSEIMEVPAKHLFACCRRPAHRRPFQPQFLSGIWPLIVALLVAWPFSLRAVPPANDQCAGAQEVPSNGPFPYATITVDISDATITGDPPRPSCPTFPSTASRSVWYTFTPAVGEL